VPAKDQAARSVAEIGRRVKRLREAANLSLDQLSRMSGVSKAMLSQVERSRANPTVVVLLKIAGGLGCSPDELLGPTEAPPSITVLRHDDPRALFRRSADCVIRTLSPLGAEKNIEFYLLELAARGALRSEPHFERTEEFLAVAAGRIRVVSGDQSVVLRRGDSAHYRADVRHAIENMSARPARAYLVVKYDVARS